MPPIVVERSKLDDLNDTIIRSICKEVMLEKITYLNLFNNKLSKIKCLSGLVNVKTLILSFN
jgi:Leucine-rich repeat (LRR) protein